MFQGSKRSGSPTADSEDSKGNKQPKEDADTSAFTGKFLVKSLENEDSYSLFMLTHGSNFVDSCNMHDFSSSYFSALCGYKYIRDSCKVKSILCLWK